MSDEPTSVDEQPAVQAPAAQATQTGGKPSMAVKIYSPFHNYYDGPAFSLSAENATGPFDILPKHHNFISLLTPCEVVVRTVDQGEQKFKIGGGIIHVKADQTIVFLDV
ncbi:MAG TPA: F0F1 ATP synthase subunit epsilon [Candidatus Saccharimonadales bacterium]|nr:F0F1 ATP synthase subunit epsilon [Candidatus Saccharimonadales bacterium]